LARLPLSVANGLAWCIAWLWWNVVPIRRAVAVQNVGRAFPEWRSSKVRATLTAMLHNIVLGYIELLVSERTGVSMVEAAGVEQLQPGSILLAGHGGSWDLSLLALSDRTPTALFLKPPADPWVRAQITALRARHGLLGLSTGATLTDGYAALASGRALLFIQDQRFNKGIQSLFFGVPCRTSTGFAAAVLRSGRPVYGVWQERLGVGRHRFWIAPFSMPSLTGDDAMDVQALTDAANAWYADRIRERPSGWLWLHDRWKR
jgi:KDO2-lipid IV(A) lauroyltransferase